MKLKGTQLDFETRSTLKVPLTNNYPAGGYEIEDVNPSQGLFVAVTGISSPGSRRYIAAIDFDNKLHVLETFDGGASFEEVKKNTDLSDVSVMLLLYSKKKNADTSDQADGFGSAA